MPVRLRASWRMSARVTLCGKAKVLKTGAVVKASIARCVESQGVDTKLCELHLGRMKRE